MKLLAVEQGTPEWRVARGNSHPASEAPVMMGASKHTSRIEYLRMKSNGDERVFSEWAQKNLLDRGHELEERARVLLEEALGTEFYPATGTTDDGFLLASADGVTMDGDDEGEDGYEHKSWNEELVAMVRAGELSPAYYWQLEQLIEVFKLKRIYFCVSDGTREKFLYMVYTAVPGRREQLYAGWRQFDEDVKNYVHVEPAVKPAPAPQMTLPALAIDMRGDIELVSNLPKFGERLREFLAGIDKKPSTDVAFATAEAQVKILEETEAKLKLAEDAALSRFNSIDEMRGMMATFRKLCRDSRLELGGLIKVRKDEIRDEIRREHVDFYVAHITQLQKRLSPYHVTVPVPPANFAEAMKGKKTVQGLRDACHHELTRVKLASNEVVDRIDVNLKHLAATAPDHGFLFADLQAICGKAADDFALLVLSRVNEHTRLEALKLAAAEEKKRQDEERARAATAPAVPAPAALAANDPPAVQAAASGGGRPVATLTSMSRRPKPSDDVLLAVLADHFEAPEATVIEWLREVDLDAAARRHSEVAA